MQAVEFNHFREYWQRLQQRLTQSLKRQPVSEENPLTYLGICLLRRMSVAKMTPEDIEGPPLITAVPLKDD